MLIWELPTFQVEVEEEEGEELQCFPVVFGFFPRSRPLSNHNDIMSLLFYRVTLGRRLLLR